MLLTDQEAARIIGVTAPAIYYFRQTGRLQTIRLFNRYLFDSDDVEKLIKARGIGFPHPGRPKLKKAEALTRLLGAVAFHGNLDDAVKCIETARVDYDNGWPNNPGKLLKLAIHHLESAQLAIRLNDE